MPRLPEELFDDDHATTSRADELHALREESLRYSDDLVEGALRDLDQAIRRASGIGRALSKRLNREDYEGAQECVQDLQVAMRAAIASLADCRDMTRIQMKGNQRTAWHMHELDAIRSDRVAIAQTESGYIALMAIGLFLFGGLYLKMWGIW